MKLRLVHKELLVMKGEVNTGTGSVEITCEIVITMGNMSISVNSTDVKRNLFSICEFLQVSPLI